MTALQPQTTIDERVVQNDELEQALEQRQTLKVKAGEARKAYTEADEQAKALARELDLADGPVRVGRFVLTEHDVPGRSVAFDTDPSTRLTIRVDPE
jgi:hypothetical protein